MLPQPIVVVLYILEILLTIDITKIKTLNTTFTYLTTTFLYPKSFQLIHIPLISKFYL